MGLKGTLAELPLADLVEMTSLGGKSGRLTLFDEEGAAAGELAFRDGRLVGAVCGELGAEKAFYALLALQDGAFDFDPEAELGDAPGQLDAHGAAGGEPLQRPEGVVFVGVSAHQQAFDDVGDGPRLPAAVVEDARFELVFRLPADQFHACRRRQLAAQQAQLVEAPHAFHEQRRGGQVAALVAELCLRVEVEGAVLEGEQSVERLLGAELAAHGAGEAAVPDSELAGRRALFVEQHETAGLAAQRGHLDEVGQRQLGEGALQAHVRLGASVMGCASPSCR